MQLVPITFYNRCQILRTMKQMGVSSQGISILSSKCRFFVFKVTGIRTWAANVVKQHLLSLGGDAALERAALIKDAVTDILIFGTASQLRQVCAKLAGQPFGLAKLSIQLRSALEHSACQLSAWYARDKRITLTRPVVCGIINITTDSFSGDGIGSTRISCAGASSVADRALAQAERMLTDGARMLDIGAVSTRPGARSLAHAVEVRRLVPVIQALRRRFPRIVLSVDTCTYAAARAAVECGIDVLNDITGFSDARMAALAAKHALGCVVMHMQGKPATMQRNPQYQDIMPELARFFETRLATLYAAGIQRRSIMIDPGIGFGKRLGHNLEIMRELGALRIFGVPIFIGVSRKSCIGAVTGQDNPANRVYGTIAAQAVAYIHGARIFRTHDVRAAVEALAVARSITQ